MKSILTLLIFSLLASSASAQQSVFLDFDSGDDGNINYTANMRDAVQSLMSSAYQPFDITFSQSAPSSGPFTTLTFNSGTAGGLADDIDFRNLNKSDNAVINVDGLGFTAVNDIVNLSANIGAHEFGHLLGLRHRDSFGPIGSGVLNTLTDRFLPAYSGPTNATEFGDHVMSTPAFGASVQRFTAPTWLSERSAIKVAFGESGSVTNELANANNSIATAQNVALASLDVPNTIQAGQNAGLLFDVDALSVIGSITAGDIDVFSFEGSLGELFNFEVISGSTDRLTSFDTQISLFDANGDFVDYYGQDAFNDDEIERLDSILVDVVLPADGTYFVQINGFDNNDAGDYELFFNRFAISAIPEPSSFALLSVIAIAGLTRRRR